MTDKFEDIVENLKQSSHWMRLPFMLAYGFVLYLIFVPVVIVMMVAQILFALITGESNRNLRGLGSVVQQYVSQIIDYITYNSNERPFPFSDFPEEDLGVVENPDSKMADSTARAEDLDSKLKEEKTEAKAVKKAKKSVAKSKADSSGVTSAETPSATKKPAKKKAPAKRKVSAQAASKPSDTSPAPTQTDSSTDSEPS